MSVVTVTATVDASNVPPRVRLDVADTGAPAFPTVTVTRLNPDGSTASVRTTDGNPLPMSGNSSRTVSDGVTTASSTTVTSATAAFVSGDVGASISGGSIPAGATIASVTNATTAVISAAATASATAVSLTISRPGTGIVYDYEMPYGSPVVYSSQETPANATAPVTVPETRIWLVHPGVPALSIPIELRAGSLAEENYPVTQGVFYPMGRRNPVVVNSGVRHGPESSLTVVVDTPSQLQALRDLIADAGVLLLNVPPSQNLGFDTSYIAVSDVRASRLTDIGSDPYRNFTLPFVTVDMPAGGSQSQRTLADLLAFPSLGSLMDKYATFADLLAGP